MIELKHFIAVRMKMHLRLQPFLLHPIAQLSGIIIPFIKCWLTHNEQMCLSAELLQPGQSFNGKMLPLQNIQPSQDSKNKITITQAIKFACS